MKHLNFTNVVIAGIAVSLLASCSKDQLVSNPGNSTGTSTSDKMDQDGYVYTQSNAAGGNSIYIYAQHEDGSLSLDGIIPTGGLGTDAGLGSQGSVALNESHTMLFAVNAGDNTLSSFTVDAQGALTLVSTVPSGGTVPVSVTVHNNLVYVVNSTSDNISGFQVASDGSLSAIPGSTQPLSGTGVMPAQISFNPDGLFLAVTEKATNKLTFYQLDNQGAAGAPVSINSVGRTPFGFEFRRDNSLVVSNASSGVTNESSVTAYYIDNNIFNLTITSQRPVRNFQTAACWVAIGRKLGNYAYVTNTGSNTISSYLTGSGPLVLQEQVAATTGTAPTDIVVSGDDKYVYEINSGSQTIGEYSRNADGSLTQFGTLSTDVPIVATGLAAFK